MTPHAGVFFDGRDSLSKIAIHPGSGPCRVVRPGKGGTSMARTSSGVIGVAVVLLGLVATAAPAQDVGTITFEIPYAFVVNGNEMPAGGYDLRLQRNSPVVLILSSLETKERIYVQSLTRLADMGGTEPRIVFDKVGNTYFLSEVHVPGIDGFHMQGAPGEHVHARLTGKR